MECFLNSKIDCPSFEAQKGLGYTPKLKEIRKKICPQCPNGPYGLKRNRGPIQQYIPFHGNYIF
jgi:hypothetical protein